ncbi:hypothetical protein STK_13350 [Sulfurisphaera tokodaii str. 7]|uniref:Three-Cys-motif partner protein TcmP n=1 Tax=Sulfurisphaera tokodaii (strain DSM 16993 / JCM 10545 / NBRC 100140 / 7) TaxID=273063 RepID=Q971M6_SULTO|nr:three-Cys-motif partner protein TcmP [Sulfurisphaera tokodaii]BAB66394.1 hypothetical protein STK_13350 [Sulfurisphaera tokodaii str. 7]
MSQGSNIKKSPYEKLRTILEYLVFAKNCTKNIKNILEKNELFIKDEDVSYGPHTLLKLAYLYYYFDIALEIAKKHFDKLIFVDAFGGSGLVRIKNSDYVSLGSSLLALVFKSRSGKARFNKIISIEMESKRAYLLRRRLEVLKKELGIDTDFKVIRDDVNKKINDVANDINKRDYGILFVDPEGVEIQLQNLSIILSKSIGIDVILNQSEGVYRLLGRAQNGDDSALKKLVEYLPTLASIKDPDKARDLLFRLFGKPIEATAEIRDENNKPIYELVLRVRRTKSDTPWIRPMKEFSEMISKYNGRDVLNILDQIHNKRTTILDQINRKNTDITSFFKKY